MAVSDPIGLVLHGAGIGVYVDVQGLTSSDRVQAPAGQPLRIAPSGRRCGRDSTTRDARVLRDLDSPLAPVANHGAMTPRPVEPALLR